MAKQFQVGLPLVTGEAAAEFVKTIDQQIGEFEEQLKLLRQVKAAIQATFPPHEAWIAGVANA